MKQLLIIRELDYTYVGNTRNINSILKLFRYAYKISMHDIYLDKYIHSPAIRISV